VKIQRHLVLDQNVFGKVVRNDRFRETFFRDLDGNFNTTNQEDFFSVIPVPLLVLEFSGEVSFTRPPEQDLGRAIAALKANPVVVSDTLYDLAKAHYAKQPVLQAKHLRRECNKGRKAWTVEGAKLADSIILKQLSDKDDGKYIHAALAADYQYGFPFEKYLGSDVARKVEMSFIYDLYLRDKHRVNISATRGLLRVVDELRKYGGISSDPSRLDEAQKVMTAWCHKLKPSKDLGDMEVLHYAIFGGYIGPVGKVPAIVCTSDPVDLVLNRLRAVKIISDLFLKDFNQRIKDYPDMTEYKPQPGQVVIVNQKGNITRVVKVTDLG